MRNRRTVLVDTFQLYYAMTGIGTYLRQLCSGLEESKELQTKYRFSPDWRQAAESRFFKGDIGMPKKILNHVVFFIWKQFLLPWIAFFRKSEFIVSGDFVGPMWSFNSRNIVVIHDTFLWDFPENYPGVWRRYFFLLVKLGLKKDSIVLATSEYTKEKILKTLSPPCPVEVLYQSPKLSVFNGYHHEKTLEKYGLTDVPFFLHVGVFDRRKNVQTLVRAFSIFAQDTANSKFKLVLVGGKGRGRNLDDYDTVNRLISELNLKDSVVVTGYLPDGELSDLYRGAFSFVFPSLDEGFGIPVLEAFHARTPLIIADRGSLQEVAGDGALVFDALNPIDLAQKMNKVKSPEVRTELIRKGLGRVSNFGKEKFAKDLDLIVAKYSRK